MLARMAKAYRRPLVALYLASPPRKASTGTDFRRLPRNRPAGEPLVQALVREVVARQSIIRDVLLEDEAEEITFVGSMAPADGRQALIGAVQDLVGVRPSTASSVQSAFDALRQAVEGEGVFVLLQGDLGSYQTDIDTNVFRGFALADRVAPVVVVNDNDARAAWSFTLVHELVHLLLGETGISDNRHHAGVERLCNDVASEYLLPSGVLARIVAPPSFDALVRTIGAVAEEHNVSRAMVAYRLHGANAITQEMYGRAVAFFRASWLRTREQERERNRVDAGGPSYYVIRRHRAGKALVDFVRSSLANSSMPTTKAAIALGVKPTQVAPMLAGAV